MNVIVVRKLIKLTALHSAENNGMKDLFEHQNELPNNVIEILERQGDEHTYEELGVLLKELEAEGYTFEYGLDAVPFNLKKMEI